MTFTLDSIQRRSSPWLQAIFLIGSGAHFLRAENSIEEGLNSVCDGRCHARHCHLTQSFGAQRVEACVGLVDEVDLNAADVCSHGQHVLGKVGVEKASVARVDLADLASGSSRARTGNKTRNK